jgi:hypothetical protein
VDMEFGWSSTSSTQVSGVNVPPWVWSRKWTEPRGAWKRESRLETNTSQSNCVRSAGDYLHSTSVLVGWAALAVAGWANETATNAIAGTSTQMSRRHERRPSTMEILSLGSTRGWCSRRTSDPFLHVQLLDKRLPEFGRGSATLARGGASSRARRASRPGAGRGRPSASRRRACCPARTQRLRARSRGWRWRRPVLPSPRCRSCG